LGALGTDETGEGFTSVVLVGIGGGVTGRGGIPAADGVGVEDGEELCGRLNSFTNSSIFV
jgi:hypothetical protein